MRERAHRARPGAVDSRRQRPDDLAEFVGTKMSADKLVDVELRAFNASIEAGVIAPPQTLAELRPHPVVKSYD